MDFRKLPSNSEGLLLKLVCSENPTQVLREQYNGLSTQQEQELDGIQCLPLSIRIFSAS